MRRRAAERTFSAFMDAITLSMPLTTPAMLLDSCGAASAAGATGRGARRWRTVFMRTAVSTLDATASMREARRR